MNELLEIFSEVLRISTFQAPRHRRPADGHHPRGIVGAPARHHHDHRIGAGRVD